MQKRGERAKWIRRGVALLGVLLVVWIGAVLVAIWNATRTRQRAELFLRDFVAIELGKSTIDDVRRLASVYGGTESEWNYAPPDCLPECRIFRFWFENRWYYRLRVGPATAMLAGAEVSGGRVIGRGIAIESTAADDAAVVVDESLSSRTGKPFQVRFRLLRPRWCVEFTPAAAEAQKRAAWALNLECLSKLRGCKDREDFLPGVWETAP